MKHRKDIDHFRNVLFISSTCGYESHTRQGDYLPRPVVGKQTLLSTRVCYVWTLCLVAGIVSHCCLVACQNSVDEKRRLEFFKFLASANRRLKRWTEAVRRSARRAKCKSKRYTVILFICICICYFICICVSDDPFVNIQGNLIITVTTQSVCLAFSYA